MMAAIPPSRQSAAAKKKRNAKPQQKPTHRHAIMLIRWSIPGSPPHRNQTRSKAHSARSCHRMVILAQGPPGRSTARSSQKTATVVLGSVGDQVVTTCMLIVVRNLARGGRPFGIIENVVTDSAHRRRGFGTLNLAAADDRAWSMNCYKIVLTTGSTRPSTWEFYERAGLSRGTKTAFEIRR